MSGKRLKTLVIAGCLTLDVAGCRSCLVSPLSCLRDHGDQRDTCAVDPPAAPQATSDQNRSMPPSASPSSESPDSADYQGDSVSPESPAPVAESDEAARQAQERAAEQLKQLGGRVTADADGVVTAVDLAETAITDVDLQLLAACPGLLELNLRGTLVTDAGLETVASLSRLEFLGLTGTMVTDAGMTHVQQLTELRFLTLGHTAVTDAGLSPLAGCPQLEGLNLKATAVTAAGLVEFQARLPQCRIVSDVTSTTSIDSAELPLPMHDDSKAATESLAPPMPPPDAPGAIPEPPQEIPVPTTGRWVPRPMERADGDDRPARSSVDAAGPAVRLDRVLSQSLTDPDVLRAIAQSYAERNEWDAAASVLREAVERTPDDRQLQFELGVAEARSGDYVAALMHLQQCGDLAVAHYNLGVLMHEAGLRDAAVLAFRSALRYEPGLSQARVWLTELAPAQAAAAAGSTGRRPAMIGAQEVTPVEGQSTNGADGAVEEQENSGIEIRPARARRVKKRDKSRNAAPAESGQETSGDAEPRRRVEGGSSLIQDWQQR